jgi:hypothetical protein
MNRMSLSFGSIRLIRLQEPDAHHPPPRPTLCLVDEWEWSKSTRDTIDRLAADEVTPNICRRNVTTEVTEDTEK